MNTDLTEILQDLKPEHFSRPCSKNHTKEEILPMDLECEECGGTGVVLTPAGEALWETYRCFRIRELRNLKKQRESRNEAPEL